MRGGSAPLSDHFRSWKADGFFQRLWAAGLAACDEGAGIDWQWQSLDGVRTQASFGGAVTGANPSDRGTAGTKRRTLCEGHGLPLSVVVDGANRTDMKLTVATLEALVVVRPAPTPAQPQRLGRDAGYDYPVVWQTAREQGYEPHVRPQQQERAHAGRLDPLKRPLRLLVR